MAKIVARGRNSEAKNESVRLTTNSKVSVRLSKTLRGRKEGRRKGEEITTVLTDLFLPVTKLQLVQQKEILNAFHQKKERSKW